MSKSQKIELQLFEKTSLFAPAFSNLYDYLASVTRPFNESKMFAGVMIIILNLATKHVNWNLPKPIESYLKYTFSRNILVFAICWMGSRDILVAAILTLVFIIIMDYILNDKSEYCCLPEGFVDYHTKILEENTKILEEKKVGETPSPTRPSNPSVKVGETLSLTTAIPTQADTGLLVGTF